MPYYTGDYYQGDNYQRGDFLGIGGFAKKLVGNLVGNIPVIGGIAKTLIPSLGGTPVRSQIMAPVGAPEPGITGMIHRAAPGGAPGYGYYDNRGVFRDDGGRRGHYKKDGTWTDRGRPRMQVTNTRALKRAGRRVRGFLKIASRLGALPISRSGKGKLFKRKRK